MFLSRFVPDELDDPLSFYEQAILNHVQKNDLMSAYAALEKTVNSYKYDLRYQNSPRYLKLWLIFAFCQKSPVPFLQRLIDSRIGHNLSILYEAIAYEQVKENRQERQIKNTEKLNLDRIKEAEVSLLLGIENKAVPLKRLKRVHSQFTANHSIHFNKQEFALNQYKAILDIKSTEIQEHVDDENILLYTSPEVFPNQDKPLMTKLSWLSAQLEHHARASILREVYYQNEEMSLEELRARHGTTMSTIQEFRTWKEPEMQNRAQKQVHQAPRKTREQLFDSQLIQEAEYTQKSRREQNLQAPKRTLGVSQEQLFGLRPIQQVKNTPKLIKKQKQQISKRAQERLFNLQSTPQYEVKKTLKLIKEHIPRQHKKPVGQTPPIVQQKSTKQTSSTTKVRLVREITGRSAHGAQTKEPVRGKHVVELPHSPEFVQAQINTSGARIRPTFHIIKYSGSNIQRTLSSWFVYDKKKTSWRSSAKKEKKSMIRLLGNEFLVIDKLGEGGMGQVYLVQDAQNLKFYGLKVQQPPNPWEFYIHHQIDQRNKQGRTAFRLLPILDYYYFVDTSFLLMPYIRHGTLLDAYNRYIQIQKSMPEPVIAFFIAQIIQQVNSLHSLDISHNDIKLDNVMLISKNKDTIHNVILIDFGHSIDIRALKHKMCKANWPAACSRSQYPLFNTGYIPAYADYWEIAAMAHRLLYGEPMQTLSTHDGKFVIRQNIKRYWHADLWSTFFCFLLNQPNEQTNINHLLQRFEKLQVPDTLIRECIQVLYH